MQGFPTMLGSENNGDTKHICRIQGTSISGLILRSYVFDRINEVSGLSNWFVVVYKPK